MATEPTEDASKAINLHHPTEKDLKQFKRGYTTKPVTFKDNEGNTFTEVLQGYLIPFVSNYALIITHVATIKDTIPTPKLHPYSYIVISRDEVTIIHQKEVNYL